VNGSIDQARDLHQKVAEGLLYTHSRLSAGAKKTLEASSFLYALIELLNEKGLLTIEELDARKEVVAERLMKRFRENGSGVMLQDPEYDKYAFDGESEVDCAERIDVCRAVCCRLPFALSKQDIHEGIVHWELGRPYLIAHNGEGYCEHMDAATRQCTIREHRPVPCRAYDCRQDKRVWLDYEARILNPAVERPDWPYCLAPESRLEPDKEQGSGS
jgi:Fe-S-cluster containining protein